MIDTLGDLKGLRALNVARNSSLDEDSHSDERQTESIGAFIHRNEMLAVGIVKDEISGGVKPWDRDELGPWLKGEREDFDAIVATTIDRVSRSQFDYLELRQWCIDNKKKLIILQHNMDMASEAEFPMFVGSFASMFAQMELMQIKRRLAGGRRDSIKYRKALGGQMPYWCQQIPHESGKGLKWVLHPGRAAKALEMIEWIEDGGTRNALAAKFNKEGRPTPKREVKPDGKTAAGKRRNNKGKGYAGLWTSHGIKALLDSMMLIGRYEYEQWEGPRNKHKPIPGTRRILMEDGADEHGNATSVPVQYCEPLLIKEDGTPDVERFERFRALLSPRDIKRSGGRPLTQLVFCVTCGSATYGKAPRQGEAEWQRCQARTGGPHFGKCTAKAVKAQYIMSIIENDFASVMGDREICERIERKPVDTERQRDMMQAEYDDLFDSLRTAPAKTRERYAPRQRFLEAEIERLSLLPKVNSSAEYVSTGRTVKDLWSEDWASNAKLLRSLGMRVLAGDHTVKIEYPEDIDSRLQTMWT